MGAKSVCIVGGGFQNKGAEAMTMTVFRAVKERFPDAQVYARVPKGDFAAASRDGMIPLALAKGGMIGRMVSKLKTASLIARGTTLIDVSGFQFGDDWPAGVAQRRAATVRRFVNSGNAVFFMPQAWGPFQNTEGAAATRNILESATLSYVRDQTSLKSVRSLLGKELPGVKLAHDLAWDFNGSCASVGRAKIEAAGIKTSELLVCVTPNMRVYERAQGKGAENTYVKFMAGMIEHLCRAHRASVIVLGHELRNDGSKVSDDRSLGEIILAAIDRTLPVVHLREQYTAGNLKSIIGQCDLLISSRYHALIAALSQHVPVAAAGWSHKYAELLSEAGAGVLLSADDPAESTRESLDRLVAERLEMRSKLADRVPLLRQNSRSAMSRVLDLIAERQG